MGLDSLKEVNGFCDEMTSIRSPANHTMFYRSSRFEARHETNAILIVIQKQNVETCLRVDETSKCLQSHAPDVQSFMRCFPIDGMANRVFAS